MPFPASPHPYPSNYDQTWVYTAASSVKYMRLHFSPLSEIHAADLLCVTSGGGGWAWFDKCYTGLQLADTWVWTKTNTFTLTMLGDPAGGGTWGFEIIEIEEYGETIPSPPFTIANPIGGGRLPLGVAFLYDFYIDSTEPADLLNVDWTIVAGSLPPGLTLANHTEGGYTYGRITGTATSAGLWWFNIQARQTLDGRLAIAPCLIRTGAQPVGGYWVQPAVLMDTGLLVIWPATANQWHGPVVYAGKKWLTTGNSVNSGTPKIYFYSSSDWGWNWDLLDQTNAPSPYARSTAYDTVGGNRWWMAYTLASSSTIIRIRSFRLDTSIYESELTTLNVGYTVSSYSPAICLVLYPESPLRFLLAYVKNLSSYDKVLCYRIWNGSAWGSEVQVDSIVGFALQYLYFDSIVRDANNRMHIFYRFRYGTYNELRYALVNPDGSLGPKQTIRVGNLQDKYQTAIYKLDTDEVVISAEFYGDPSAGVYRGSPSSAPLFSYEQVVPPDGSYPADYVSLAVSTEGDYTTLYLFFVRRRVGSFTNAAIWFASNSGSGWSAPTLFYDAESNPPDLPPAWSLDQLELNSVSFFAGAPNWAGVEQGGLLTNPSLGACNIIFYHDGPLPSAASLLHTTDALLIAGPTPPVAHAAPECEFYCTKHPDDQCDYEMDWSDWLNSDTITNSAWGVTAGLTLGANSHTASVTTVRLTGGTGGQDYYLVCRIDTLGGLTELRTTLVRVRSCAVGADEPGPFPQPQRLLV